MSSKGFYIAVILIGCLFNFSTIFIEKRVKTRFVKYIPGILGAILAAGLYIKAFYYSEGFGDLGYFIISIIMAAASAASLITAAVLDITRKKRI